jgi:hypothetical protein
MPQKRPPLSVRVYAGIGSRETPPEVLEFMETVARGYAMQGTLLRSGGAKGADTAFEKGCDAVEGEKEIFRPEHATAEALEHASQFHPNWHACGVYAKKLHARNSMIILGADLDDPVDFVICWTPKGVKIGGTAQGLRVAEAHGITVLNLGNEEYGFSG